MRVPDDRCGRRKARGRDDVSREKGRNRREPVRGLQERRRRSRRRYRRSTMWTCAGRAGARRCRSRPDGRVSAAERQLDDEPGLHGPASSGRRHRRPRRAGEDRSAACRRDQNRDPYRDQTTTERPSRRKPELERLEPPTSACRIASPLRVRSGSIGTTSLSERPMARRTANGQERNGHPARATPAASASYPGYGR